MIGGSYMAKYKEKIKARELRKQGQSIKEIAKTLKVSKSSVSVWCRNIKLTKEQIARLDEKQLKGGYKGRMKGARIQKERRLKRIETLKKEGMKEINDLNKRDLFIAGIGLYCGEGSKTGTAVRFHNSDPNIIQFMMKWFREIFQIPTEQFAMYIVINEIHKNRLDKVIKYWSKITKIPIKQFKKPTLAKVKNKKIYANFHEHFGTLSIRINKSYDTFYKIQGYIEIFYKKTK